MSDPTLHEELSGHVLSQLSVLEEVYSFLISLLKDDIGEDRSRKNGLVVAGILENYYTAAETALFRVAQDFGNSLDTERWHADLLDRLSHDVPDIRPRVLSGYTHERLDELRRFRHFKRYYYRLDYDWDKLDFLVKKLTELHPRLLEELRAFLSFLREIAVTGPDKNE